MPTLKEFMTDPELEKAGRWVEWLGGIRLRVARWGNPAFEAELERLREPHIKEHRNGTLPTELAEEITKRAAASTILLDWANIQDEETLEDLPYSPEVGFRYLSDPRCRDFWLYVCSSAMRAANYRLGADADAKKD